MTLGPSWPRIGRPEVQRVIDSELEPEDEYEVLDAGLTELLEKAGVDFNDEEIMVRLLAYNRRLRIALKLPVEVPC